MFGCFGCMNNSFDMNQNHSPILLGGNQHKTSARLSINKNRMEKNENQPQYTALINSYFPLQNRSSVMNSNVNRSSHIKSSLQSLPSSNSLQHRNRFISLSHHAPFKKIQQQNTQSYKIHTPSIPIPIKQNSLIQQNLRQSSKLKKYENNFRGTESRKVSIGTRQFQIPVNNKQIRSSNRDVHSSSRQIYSQGMNLGIQSCVNSGLYSGEGFGSLNSPYINIPSSVQLPPSIINLQVAEDQHNYQSKISSSNQYQQLQMVNESQSNELSQTANFNRHSNMEEQIGNLMMESKQCFDDIKITDAKIEFNDVLNHFEKVVDQIFYNETEGALFKFKYSEKQKHHFKQPH